MRVLVDGRVMQNRYHGIGRYTFEILKAMPVEADVEWRVLTTADLKWTRLPVAELSQRSDMLLVATGAPLLGVSSQLAWPALARDARPDVVFVPYHLAAPWWHGGVPVVAVLHDCIFETAPAFAVNRAMRAEYRAATWLALRRSDAVVTVSHATAADLRRFYGRAADAVVPHAVGDQFRVGQAETTRDSSPPRPYILHVGVRRPHKNLTTLVRALRSVVDRVPSATLVLVGEADDRFVDEVPGLVERLGLRDHVAMLDTVADSRLVELYRKAAVLAFPSFVEGFGLPVLEAMAAGVPVVASDAPAVTEAGGGAALTVPARDPQAWAEALSAVLLDDGLVARLRQAGHRVAASTHWATSAATTLDVLRGHAHRPGGSRHHVG